LAGLSGCTGTILNRLSNSLAKPVDVNFWPLSNALIESFQPELMDLFVLGVTLCKSHKRETARAQLRGVVIAFLAALYKISPTSIFISSASGQSPNVLISANVPALYLSFSHQPGLSVAVMDWFSPVGIDLMEEPQDFDWRTLARDYLGQHAFERIASFSPPEQLRAFSNEWTRLEAGLKGIGLGLAEWNSAQEMKIQTCQFMPLCLPKGFVGMVARTLHIKN
jgi:phosphopantetheinyl transferase